MHKTRNDLFSNAPAHVQRQLHDLRAELRKHSESQDLKRKQLRRAEALESWEEIKLFSRPIS